MTPRRPSANSNPSGRPGKWPADRLARLLRTHAAPLSNDVLLGPRIGEDAAVVRIGSERLVVATDPITFATDAIGHYAVVVNANDVAVTGARPRFFLATVLLPVDADDALAETIFSGIAEACRALDCLWVGGHTERAADLHRPVVVGTMIGDLGDRPLVSSGGARAGDVVLMTKGAAIEATALIAREKGAQLAGAVGKDVLARAREYLTDPGLSVVPEARIACDRGARALHDVTEGGVVTGLWEMAEAAGLGLQVDADAIFIRDETRALCEAAGIDPLEAIGSGSLLAAAPPEKAPEILAALGEAGIRAAQVATFGRPGAERTIARAGRTVPLVPPPTDAIAKLYA